MAHKVCFMVNEKARGHSQPWNASDRGGLGSIFITEKQKKGPSGKCQQEETNKSGKET